MTSMNMHNYQIEQTSSINDQIYSGSLITYKTGGGSYVPDKIYSLETTSPISSFTYFNGTSQDSHYNALPDIDFNYYDTSGNTTQTTGKDGIITSYLWDSSRNYLIAKVINATYSQISSQDGKGMTYNSLTLHNSLKNLVTDNLITTYSYKPLVGMTSQTDPNGLTTHYEYDGFGRLKSVLDNDNRVTGHYKYNYANEVAPPPPSTTLTLSTVNHTFDFNGGSASISVTCNAAWTATSDSYWLTVTPDSGTNNGSFTISCNPISEPQNNATVTVTSGGISKTVSVTQNTLDFNLVPINSFHVGGPDNNPLISNPSDVSLWYYFPFNNLYDSEFVQFESSVAPESVTFDVFYAYGWAWLYVYYDYSTNQLSFWTTSQPNPEDWAVICITSGGTTKRISVKACDF